MELNRTLLLAGLLVVSYLLWNNWNEEHAKQNVAPAAAMQTLPAGSASTGIPQIDASKLASQAANAGVPAPTGSAGATNAAASSEASSAPALERLVTVKTDVLEAQINLNGGDIEGLKLWQYPQALQDKKPVQLLSADPRNYYVANSGLVSKAGPDTQTKRAHYQVSQHEFNLGEQKQIKVDLTWQSPEGLKVIKTFTFTKDSYLIDVSYKIQNLTDKEWQGNIFGMLKRYDMPEENHSLFGARTFQGAAYYNQNKKFTKLTLADINKARDANGYYYLGTWEQGWVAMLQHYFLSSWVPPTNEQFTYQAGSVGNNVYQIALIGPTVKLAAQDSKELGLKLYAGPEITDNLKVVAQGLDRTIDYGILWPIAILLLWLLQHINSLVGNWGWSIIIITILIKLAFYHLSATSYRSMAKLRKIQPKIEHLRQRYANDKQKLSQEMMELYRKEKANPFGGCLPILVQIPVFIALYWVLIESVELRQAPFIFWIKDLSTKDPYYILPIIMGVTMIIQQKLSPPPPDPTQAKLMMAMPVIFTVLFLYFPAGLVLYWVVNNALSILQQWWITRTVERESAKK